MASYRDDDDMEEDVGAKAYASIAAQLQQFTSPKLGSLMAVNEKNDNPYAMDAMEWMQQELDEEDQPLVMQTPKRTPLFERADTPIMSNSSSKLPKVDSTLASEGDENDDEDEFMMEPVQTPFKVHPVATPRALPTTMTTTTSPSTSTGSQYLVHTHTRYHNALWNYLKAKRSLSHRMDLEQQDQALDGGILTTTDMEGTTATASSLANQEKRVELEFLSTLCQLCWSNPNTKSTQSEGDLWRLLMTLRRLGLSALIWEHDRTSSTQHLGTQTAFLQQLAANTSATPKELLDELASTEAPLIVQRRHQILTWIETCLDQIRVEPKSGNIPSAAHPDDEPSPSLVNESNTNSQQQQTNLLQACLSYILAGRLDDAKALARSQGQPWRAAAWSGGAPTGFHKVRNEQTQTVDLQPTGNPHRFLWKRQVWKNGRRCLIHSSTHQHQPEEAAIYSILANDVQTSLANPSLRTWSHSLYAVLASLWGRTQDELLHMHNTHRRHCRPPYPGTDHEQPETEQLLATSQLAHMTESHAIQMLSSSPYPTVQGSVVYESATAAFLIGKNAILDYCQAETSQTELDHHDSSDDNNDDNDNAKLVRLRFLTHLTLYLDSLHASSTPIVLEGITEEKNQLLFWYVQYLESRPYLWHMVALYVSLLPEDQLMDLYPTMLVKVLEETERKRMLEQMRELFPDLQLPVLRQVVRLALSSSTDNDENKCKSLQWLLQSDEHLGDALICANLLLRDFFLNEQEDKMETAMVFVEDYLPEDLVESVVEQEDGGNLDNARSEHLAFCSYLEAYRTFGKWKDILSETPVNNDTARVDLTYLNPTETNIAQQRMVKDWVRQKKTHSRSVLQAAEQARNVLRDVLTHPGGWLSTEQEKGVEKDEEEITRQRGISEIRARYLVLAVNLYHQVCEETASWLSRSLDDAASVTLTRDQALSLLEDESYAPNAWYQHALNLATLIADDRHGIYKAFGSIDLQDILAKLAETAISKLMNA
jgi:hypothetical protein